MQDLAEVTDARQVVRELYATAERDVMTEAGAVVAFHRAQDLIADVEAMLAEADAEVERLEKSRDSLKAETTQIQDQIPLAKAARDVAAQQRNRIIAGIDSGAVPDVDAHQAKVKELEHHRGELGAQYRTEHNRLLDARIRRDRLVDVLREFQAIEEPATPALDVVLAE
jgi:phage shock protein A